MGNGRPSRELGWLLQPQLLQNRFGIPFFTIYGKFGWREPTVLLRRIVLMRFCVLVVVFCPSSAKSERLGLSLG